MRGLRHSIHCYARIENNKRLSLWLLANRIASRRAESRSTPMLAMPGTPSFVDHKCSFGQDKIFTNDVLDCVDLAYA